MTKAEKTRQFIIEQSAPIFNTRGVAATAMSDIMEATKLSKGSLYAHFENKEELSYCVADYCLNGLVSRTTAVAGKHVSAKAKLLAVFDYLGDPLNPPLEGGCPMINLGMEADDTSPVILKKVYKTILEMQQGVSSIIELGIQRGEFYKEWDSKKFATKAFALVEGGILLSRVSGNNEQMNIIMEIIKDEIEQMSK